MKADTKNPKVRKGVLTASSYKCVHASHCLTSYLSYSVFVTLQTFNNQNSFIRKQMCSLI